jgi:hypothetical protein
MALWAAASKIKSNAFVNANKNGPRAINENKNES